MALVVKDRVRETTTTTGTGTYTLAGAVTGFQTFSVIGNANTTYYTATNGIDWEVGVGTYTSSGTTLSRDVILESSNSGSAVDWGAGDKDVFVTYPAEVSVSTDNVVTLTNKRVTQRIGTVADAATITPTADSSDQYNVTALAQAATIAAPSGTPTDGQRLTIRLLDNGTGRALTWTTSSGGYRAIGVTLPTTTTANKTTYVGCIYNSAAVFWDVVAVTTQA
jgi:hypothetical protein